MSIPYLKKQGNKTILMVGDQPFIMLAGELHNSNSSTPEAMEASCKKAAELGMNSVIAPISWELVEQEEGKFDFSTVDMVIAIARKYGLKLELIWFGSWKNAQCFYAPEWVKRDMARFPRAQIVKGRNNICQNETFNVSYTTLSYLSEETCQADARAFQAVMSHIREMDSEKNTVLMVQVENETGVLGAAREHSDLADELFKGPAPEELVRYLKAHTENMAAPVKAAIEQGAASGTWEECFGSVAEEVFSAYYISNYVNKVAKAGKEAYNIPMSVNAWLEQGADPGEYPSGGPVAKMMEVWQCCAPNIDIFAPDIYVPAFCNVCDEYTKNGNPLFIPETATHGYAGVRNVYAIGHHHAICYAPFGYEDMGEVSDFTLGFLFGMDVTDPALQNRQSVEQYLQINQQLRSLLPKMAEKLGTPDLDAVTSEKPEKHTVTFGQFGFNFLLPDPDSQNYTGPGAALVLRESDEIYWMLNVNCAFAPFSTDKEKPYFDYLSLEEGYFTDDGRWHVTRYRNGDEVVMLHMKEPTLLRVKLFAYGD